MQTKFKKAIYNILIALLFLAVASYIIIQFVRNNLNNYETDYATKIIFKDNVEIPAAIFKQEVLIENNVSGAVRYFVSDGEKVGKNDSIYGIYKNNSNIMNFTLAENLKKELSIYKRSNISNTSSQADIETIDKNSKFNFLNMLENLRNEDFTKAQSFATESIVYMNRRLIASGKIQNFDDIITSLTLRINSLEGGYDTPLQIVNAKNSGYFFKQADGYEHQFKPDILNSLTVEEFENLKNSAPMTLSSNISGKICTDYSWYFACVVTPDVANRYVTDSIYPVVFTLNSQSNINAKVYKVSTTPKSDKALIIFKCDEFHEGFNYRRIQNLILNFATYEGIRVPNEAVRVLDGETGVYVITGNKIEFRLIDIIYSSGMYYISSIDKENSVSDKGHKMLQLNETIIISGNDIYEGKAIN